jgi:polyferredoxin
MRARAKWQGHRRGVQLAFVVLCLWIGIDFYLFMRWGLSSGQVAYHARPPGVEGFLPISGLIGLKHAVLSGSINRVHPAALVILGAVLLTSVVVKKAFCSWLCPIGTLSEALWRVGEKLTGRALVPPRWLDWPLRSLKYLGLAFFVWAIWQMDLPSLTAFVNSPYNQVADVKMYLFFARLSGFALQTVVVLAVLSLFVRNPWCRFLCPYGALLGLSGMASPVKITRATSTCTNCRLCTRACPSLVRVHTAHRVWSDECTGCLDCVAACPVPNTLALQTRRGRALTRRAVAVLVVGLFSATVGLAMLTGHWKNDLTAQDYLRHFARIDSGLYQHNRGRVPSPPPKE